MITYKITGIKELQDKLGGYARQVPFAMSRALNKTARGAQGAVVQELYTVFDRPTPFIIRSVQVKTSDKSDLTAQVYISDEGVYDTPDGEYSAKSVLLPHMKGGNRTHKKSEIRLIWNGMMRPNQYIVPGPGAPLDRHGNISAGQMQRILGFIKAYSERGYNVTKKSESYFVKKFVGVYKQVSRKRNGPPPICILRFQDEAVYKAGRFKFYESAGYYIKQYFGKIFSDSLRDAIRTAK